MDQIINDGPFRATVKHQAHEGVVYSAKTQVNEDAILAENAEKRKMEHRPGKWAWQVAQIPAIMYDKWLRENPELRSPNKEDRQAKLMQLINAHPEVRVVDNVLTR
jgi:hypothetical protein